MENLLQVFRRQPNLLTEHLFPSIELRRRPRQLILQKPDLFSQRQYEQPQLSLPGHEPASNHLALLSPCLRNPCLQYKLAGPFQSSASPRTVDQHHPGAGQAALGHPDLVGRWGLLAAAAAATRDPGTTNAIALVQPEFGLRLARALGPRVRSVLGAVGMLRQAREPSSYSYHSDVLQEA